MKIDIVTIFPEVIKTYLEIGVLGRAIQQKLLEINVRNLRDYSEYPHRQVDDYPYGGGAGMVLMAPPLIKAVESLVENNSVVILTSPQGCKFHQKLARQFLQQEHLVIICGRYRGVDQRFIEGWVDQQVSIGDYILSGGELPSMVVVETVARLIPGVLNNSENLDLDSFSNGLFEEDLYTRPREVDGRKVPDILLSGNHKQIEQWRSEQREIKAKELKKNINNKVK
ncbi:MAG: tRNA (guanosine(37)-N1)-methyltransferase TrmD [bacterium]